MFPSLAISGLNHLLADAPWARQRLSAFHGRTARFQLNPLELLVGVDGEGYFCEMAGEDADVSLELPLSSLPKVIGGAEALMGDIRISGNADFADALGFVLRKLRWDGEEALSRLMGDIAAHRSVTLLRSAGKWQLETGRKLIENFSEYLGEEQGVLVTKSALESHTRSIIELRDDLARLDKRMTKLDGQR